MLFDASVQKFIKLDGIVFKLSNIKVIRTYARAYVLTYRHHSPRSGPW